jgi:hypothetical protein
MLFRVPGNCRRVGLPYAVFVHEPFVPLTRLPWLVTGPLQRIQLWALLRGAVHVYAPVPGFVDAISGYATTGIPVSGAPVGASLAVSGIAKDVARRQLSLPGDSVLIGVFSPAASGFRRDWVAQAAERLADRDDVTWVIYGSGSDLRARGEPDGPGVRRLGTLPAERAAMVARSLDLALAPYSDGLTLRRTGAMLAIASGVATVSSTGHLFDTMMHELARCEADPVSFAAAVTELVDDASKRELLALRTRRYAELASVEALALKLAGDLERSGS